MFGRKFIWVLLILPILQMSVARSACAALSTTVTGCDTLTVAGQPCIRVTFAVNNNTDVTIFALYASTMLDQASNDTCRVLQHFGPPGWGAGPLGGGGAEWGTNPDGPPPISPGQTLGGFVVVLSRTSCCLVISGQDPVFDSTGDEQVCWSCPLATPAKQATWGRVKDVYR